MQRLRRFIPVSIYFAGFFGVVELHQQGFIASEIPSMLFAGAGFVWLFFFIWRNRSGGPLDAEGRTSGHRSVSDGASVYGSGNWMVDSSTSQYWTDGPGRSTFGD